MSHDPDLASFLQPERDVRFRKRGFGSVMESSMVAVATARPRERPKAFAGLFH